MDEWTGRGAVVTGANSGIGAAITKKLLEIGMKVVGFDKETDFLEELSKKELSAEGKLHFQKVDFTNEEEILEAFQTVEETVDGAIVLVNNASLIEKASLLDGTMKDWKEVTKVNVLCSSLCAREFIRSAKDRAISIGHIINISSPYGQHVPKNFKRAFYASSQNAAHRFHFHLRQELEFRDNCIKVTNILPKAYTEDLCDGKQMANKQRIEPEDVADAVEYVLQTAYHVQVRDIYIDAAEKFD